MFDEWTVPLNYLPKVSVGSFRPSLNWYKYRPIGGGLRNHSDQSEAVLIFLKLHFCQIRMIRKLENFLLILLLINIKDITFWQIITCSENRQLNHELFWFRFASGRPVLTLFTKEDCQLCDEALGIYLIRFCVAFLRAFEKNLNGRGQYSFRSHVNPGPFVGCTLCII